MFGPLVARLLWPLPARAHDWLAHHFHVRPSCIAIEWHYDARGKRHITRANYVLAPERCAHG